MKNFIRFIKIIFVIALMLAITYAVGPKPEKPTLNTILPSLDIPLNKLDETIIRSESAFTTLKPGNEARVVWANATKTKTPYSIVYLPGFSGTHEEGSPIHNDFAKRYGCNMYLARLQSHGLNEKEPLLDLTAANYLESAKQALAIGKLLGDKVILMSCSTGSTLGIYLTGDNPEVAANICYSPNIDVYDPKSDLLIGPWSLKLARLIFGGNYREYEASEDMKKYWTSRYRLEALIQMKLLVSSTMTEETFKKISQPVFIGYYYKNEEEQDKIVSIKRMKEMLEQVSTPEHLKREVAFDKVDAHVIASWVQSKDIESVRSETFKFAEEILQLKPITAEIVPAEIEMTH